MSQWNDHEHSWDQPSEPDTYCEECGMDRRLAALVEAVSAGTVVFGLVDAESAGAVVLSRSPMLAVAIRFQDQATLDRWLQARADLRRE